MYGTRETTMADHNPGQVSDPRFAIIKSSQAKFTHCTLDGARRAAMQCAQAEPMAKFLIIKKLDGFAKAVSVGKWNKEDPNNG